MAETQILQNVASFLPQSIIELANQGELDNPSEAAGFQDQAAVLFADISGFTALAERLSTDKADGAELLTSTLNRYFGAFIDVVQSHGGDIVKFAGDALLAIWPLHQGSTSTQDLHALSWQAFQCAQTLQATVKEAASGQNDPLSMKVGISAGEISVWCVGGVLNRRELLISGRPLAELGQANDHAKPGDIVVCPSIKKLLNQKALGKPISCNGSKTELSIKHLDSAIRFIPAAIRKSLDANQADWLNENRRISLIFVNLSSFHAQAPAFEAQQAMVAMQEALYEQEGSINKISVDDKGVSLLAALGMPPLSHADDPLRAVKAALNIERSLKQLGLPCTIGVSTGRVFCGVVGNANRREYTLMGDSVNLSARLMQAAKQNESSTHILVDEATWQECQSHIQFGLATELTLKGKAKPVLAYEPKDLTQLLIRDNHHFVGREKELELIQAFLSENAESRQHNGLIIAGRAGTGRGSLANQAARQAEQLNFKTITGQGNPMRAQTPWHVWQPLFKGLLNLSDDKLDSHQIIKALPQEKEILEHAALLEAIVPANWQDNQTTASFSGAQRADKTQALAIKIIQAISQETRLCFVIQNLEWFDQQSLELLTKLLQECSICTCMVCVDVDHASWPSRFEPLSNLESVNTLSLGPLRDEELIRIASACAGVAELPSEAQRAILDRTTGSPLFAIQITQTLLEAGQLWIDELGQAHWRAGAGSEAKIPASVDGLIISRIDKLDPAIQLSGKVAATVGQDLLLPIVRDLHPMQPTLPVLQAQFHTLRDRGLVSQLQQANESSDDRFEFINQTIYRVFYDLLPGTQRRKLHQQFARLLEQQSPTELKDCEDILAFHWLAACPKNIDDEPATALKAAEYLLKVAQRAAKLGASVEAERNFSTVLDLCKQSSNSQLLEVEIDALLGLSATRSDRYGWGDAVAVDALEKARQRCGNTSKKHQVFQALRGLWQVTVARSDYDQSLPLANELYALAEQSLQLPEHPQMLAEANRAVGTTLFWLADFDQSKLKLKQALQVEQSSSEQKSENLTLTQDTEVSARGILSWAYALTDEPQAALEQAELAVKISKAGLPPFTQAYALGAAMWACLHVSEQVMAERYASEALALCEKLGFDYFATAARVIFGWAKAWQGDPGGVEEIRTAIDAWRERGNTMGVPAFLIQLARALRKIGQTDEAQQVLNDPEFLQALPKEPWLEVLAQKMMNED